MIIHTQEVDYHTIVEVTSNNDNVYLLYDDRSNLMTDLGAGRLFQVTQIQTNMQFADCYICNVAPVFYQNKARVDNDYSDSDDHYITRIDERLYQQEVLMSNPTMLRIASKLYKTALFDLRDNSAP